MLSALYGNYLVFIYTYVYIHRYMHAYTYIFVHTGTHCGWKRKENTNHSSRLREIIYSGAILMTVVTDWAYYGFHVSKWKQLLDFFMFLQNKGTINQGSLKCIGGCSRGVVKNHGGPFVMGFRCCLMVFLASG